MQTKQLLSLKKQQGMEVMPLMADEFEAPLRWLGSSVLTVPLSQTLLQRYVRSSPQCSPA